MFHMTLTIKVRLNKLQNAFNYIRNDFFSFTYSYKSTLQNENN